MFRFNISNEAQDSNIPDISITFLNSKESKFIEIKEVQLKNIYFILVTCVVSKELISNCCKLKFPENKNDISLTLSVSKCFKFKLVNFGQ